MKEAAVTREKQRRKKDRALELMMQASEDSKGGKRLGDDEMDIDQENGARVTRGSKRGTGGMIPGLGGMGRRLA